MLREKLLSSLTGTLLGLTLAAGSIGCLQSAFDLTLGNPAALWSTVFCFTAMYALALQLPHGRPVYGCLLALTAGYLLRYGTAVEASKGLLQHLSTVYDRAYHWGTLSFGDYSPEAAVDLPLGIWAAGIALATTRTVCISKKCTLPVLLALIPLAVCAVVTDTVPGEANLFILLAGLVLLILPASVRRENRLQSIRLTAAALLPLLLGLGILFHEIPQEGYVNQTAVIQENIRTAAEYFPQLLENGLENTAASIRGKPARQVDLSRLGQRIPFTYPVMEVTAEKSGTLYLREQDYDQYNGRSWTSSQSRQEAFPHPEGLGQTLSIRTRGIRPVQYLPYYPAETVVLTGGNAENSKLSTEFPFYAVSLPENWRKTVYQSAEHAPEDMHSYLALPEATQNAAAECLQQILPSGGSNTEKADLIAALVTDCAAYSLSPDKMPPEQTDFALWFLEEAERGYCIHFAATAAVLLRAARIPARYVTGYLTEGIAGQTVTVTEEDAHAWAEYYEPRLGCWIPLEATPASAPVEITPVTVPETQASLPAVSQEEPEPTQTNLPAAPTLPEPPAEPSADSGANAFLLLLLLPVSGLILAVQRSLRLHMRRKRQHTGTPNIQALHRWREAERLARLLKETPAEELIDLAQKAKYSQHEITPEELQHFDSYCRSCLRRFREKPLHLRLMYQYLYAVY